jgi:hypothetical protein
LRTISPRSMPGCLLKETISVIIWLLLCDAHHG